jgi:hypothetical protein
MSQTVAGPSASELGLASTLGTIGRGCLDAGGVVIEASQDRDLGALMRQNPATAGGVCKALSLYWIGMHAQEKSFWEWLGTQGAIKQVHAQAIMSTFLSYDTHIKAFPGGDGDTWKDKWANDVLKPFGVVPYTGIKGNRQSRLAGRIYAVGNICDAINANMDLYFQVSLGGTAGRHAVSFYTGFNDAVFYDPNYGEYWFPRKGDLKRWLAHFMVASRYDKALGSDWIIRTYKKGK